MLSGWTFHDPLYLWLLGLLMVVAVLRRQRSVTVLMVPGAEEWQASTAANSAPWPVFCAYVGLALLIVGLARPQYMEPDTDHKRTGYDFIIAIDLSTSMYAEDFQRGDTMTNRLQAIKPMISAFINRRPDDRIGIVTFGGRAYTFAPLTFDHEWLRKQTARLSIGLIEDGTAIGDAIGVSLARLRQGQRDDDADKREGAFIVLLTDGASNKGSLDSRAAAQLAAIDGVMVYTIGAGAEGDIPMPVFDYAGNRIGTEMRASEIDTLALRDIADTTGGLFFRATDENAVEDAFRAINQDNKIEFDAPPPLISHELFHVFVLPGIALLGLALFGAVRRSDDRAST
ncbi:VWA domain-containing protein [Algiphilus sp. W345]|uniref:VWA domain-containing protein n=1 Tax=Banduia mediterranea TaxID=3075609 RepID=A0ABU2WEX3_9GAMM|nr:VWA domain-containing protein [Algiphilus sp. W345]MDT0495841.1 VWA domain-containing protein [Algiphilus sp. W345]